MTRSLEHDSTAPRPLRLSIVVPVYNEAGTIHEVLRRLQALPHAKEIIVVDDGSLDGTRDVLRGLAGGEVRVFFHACNRGKGAAVRTGIARAQGDVVVIQDADLEYNPRDIPPLLAPIERGEADVVFGSRFIGGPHRVLNFWHYVGNKVLTLLSNMVTNLNLTDMETGYKVFRTEVLRRIEIESDRFGFEPEITAKVAQLRCRIYEHPISYSGRDYDEGKKITWRDGVAALWHIARFSIRRRRPRPAPPVEVEEIDARPAAVDHRAPGG
jgi:glycosyltransferase involved in cell wall biosynthesis